LNAPLNKPYFENLDALRFFAFLSVFLSHCYLFFNYAFPNRYVQTVHRHYFYNGMLGVSFFLVLSGFLITWLLLLEKETNGRIQMGAFYMRRVLRIWPVYFLVVLAGFVIGIYFRFPLLDQNNFPYRIQPDQLKWYVSFLANYDLVVNGATSAMVNVLWSVSVEEQFYLIWPLFFLAFRTKHLPFICWGIILACFICRCFKPDSNFPTFEVMSDLALGGLLAYYCLYRSAFTAFFKQLPKKRLVLIYLLFFIYVPVKGFSHIFGHQVYLIYYPFEELILSGFFGFIILEQIYSYHSFFKIGQVAILNRLGKISYGLYAYHMFSFPLAYFIAHWLGFSSEHCLTIGISYLSYVCFEKKILALKKYFQPNPQALTEIKK
jgi:peptidoglycan/LPS O-acetylase OafA/YrhL